jgi:hypothetical protein
MSSSENHFRDFEFDLPLEPSIFAKDENYSSMAFIVAKAIGDRYSGTIQTAVTKHT